jgi:TRAP-type C4-dicarboxylate transport system permease small subunit
MEKFVLGFDGALEKLSRWGLVASLFVILGLAVAAIVLRWLGSSLLWIEPLVRHVVFASAFLGGSLATSKGVHIKVDLLTHFVDRSKSPVLQWIHRNLVALFCLVTSLGLVKASWDFFLVEREFGAPAFLEIHSAWLVAIIPVGMGLIALRFLNRLILGLIHGDARDPHRV